MARRTGRVRPAVDYRENGVGARGRAVSLGESSEEKDDAANGSKGPKSTPKKRTRPADGNARRAASTPDRPKRGARSAPVSYEEAPVDVCDESDDSDAFDPPAAKRQRAAGRKPQAGGRKGKGKNEKEKRAKSTSSGDSIGDGNEDEDIEDVEDDDDELSSERGSEGEDSEEASDAEEEGASGSEDGSDEDESEDEHDRFCKVCDDDEKPHKLLCCEKCPAVYHLYCLDPPLKRVPKGDWFCPECEASQPEVKDPADIEKFLSVREQDKDGRAVRELYVKWKEEAYMHCSWVPEAEIATAFKGNPGLKTRYHYFLRDRENGLADDRVVDDEETQTSTQLMNGIDPRWKLVDRVIGKEVSKDGVVEYLCKWQELNYDQATWEYETDLDAFRSEILKFESLRPLKDAAKGKGKGCANGKSAARRFPSSPSFVQGKLHDYQLEGLNWLFFKWQQGESVILGDEMGLGKTIQTIAFLAALEQEGVHKPHAVVVPLSTLFNWVREFETWAPHLNVVALYGCGDARHIMLTHELYVDAKSTRGQGKDRQSRVKAHVVLCTYESFMAEGTDLRRIQWGCLVVDEGHRLKGKSSKLVQELDRAKFEHRTILTGTPLQNNLDELFMLLRFLDKSKFGSLAEWQEAYSSDNLGQTESMHSLHSQLRPHLLRRLKKDVLKNLPPKKEQIVRVELSPLQKEYSRMILTKNFAALAGTSGGRSMTGLRNVMMELRKCCNHPYLIGTKDEFWPMDTGPAAGAKLIAASGKLELLDRMVARLIGGGHRTLIYSQFTRTLDIMEEWLQHRGWPFQRIDGNIAGQERQARIDAFNTDPKNVVFLLSTRAGGLGINLTSADTVVIYDSDWNPHNDLQAQARAHRMGQKSGVMIFRMVTRATVEESMLQMTKKKLVLEKVVVGKMGTLRQNDLDNLLRYGAAQLFEEEEEEEGEEGEGTDTDAAKPADAAGKASSEATTKPGEAAEKAAEAVPGHSEAGEKSSAASAEAAEKSAEGTAGRGPSGGTAGPSEAAQKPAEAAGKPGEAGGKAAEAAAEASGTARSSATEGGDSEGEGGGGNAGKKRKKRKGEIVYDDAALDALLDRGDLKKPQKEVDKDDEDAEDDELMASFKVATFDLKNPEEAAAAEAAAEAATKPQAVGKTFWTGLLGAQVEAQDEAKLAAMGRGRRSRKDVNYNADEAPGFADINSDSDSDSYDDAFDPEGERQADDENDENGTQEDAIEDSTVPEGRDGVAAGPSGRASVAAARAAWESMRADAPLPPLLSGATTEELQAAVEAAHESMEGQMALTRLLQKTEVYGLTSRERALFIKLLMTHGILVESAPPGAPDAAPTYRWQKIEAGLRRPSKIVRAYGELLLTHIAEARQTPHLKVFPDGIPTVVTFPDCRISMPALMERLGVIFTIHNKLQACKDCSPEAFHIDVPRQPKRHPHWGPAQDHALLVKLNELGHGKWRQMATSPELQPHLRATLGAPADYERHESAQVIRERKAQETNYLKNRVHALTEALRQEATTGSRGHATDSPDDGAGGSAPKNIAVWGETLRKAYREGLITQVETIIKDASSSTVKDPAGWAALEKRYQRSLAEAELLCDRLERLVDAGPPAPELGRAEAEAEAAAARAAAAAAKAQTASRELQAAMHELQAMQAAAAHALSNMRASEAALQTHAQRLAIAQTQVRAAADAQQDAQTRAQAYAELAKRPVAFAGGDPAVLRAAHVQRATAMAHMNECNTQAAVAFARRQEAQATADASAHTRVAAEKEFISFRNQKIHKDAALLTAQRRVARAREAHNAAAHEMATTRAEAGRYAKRTNANTQHSPASTSAAQHAQQAATQQAQQPKAAAQHARQAQQAQAAAQQAQQAAAQQAQQARAAAQQAQQAQAAAQQAQQARAAAQQAQQAQAAAQHAQQARAAAQQAQQAQAAAQQAAAHQAAAARVQQERARQAAAAQAQAQAQAQARVNAAQKAKEMMQEEIRKRAAQAAATVQPSGDAEADDANDVLAMVQRGKAKKGASYLEQRFAQPSR